MRLENKKKMADERIEIGDRHSGRATTLVRHGTAEYIYKPRSAKTERAWETFLRELQAEGLLFAPGCVCVLREGEDFHEVKLVKQAPAADKKEAESYFRSCGTLLFLTYLLNSNDLHCENLIAAGSAPVLVDLETLLTGEIDRRREYENLMSLTDSVTYSHLLPNFTLDGDESVDVGGITGSNSESKNALFLDGKRQMAYDYLPDILYGFELSYRFALERKELVSEELRLFEPCRFRQLLRPTKTYSKIIDFVGKLDGDKKRQAAYELLARAYKLDVDPKRIEKMSAVLEAEVSAVCNGDIPLFNTPGDSCDLFDGDERLLCDFLLHSPVEKALSRLSFLSESDLLSQSKIIKQALSALCPPLCCKSSQTSALVTIEKTLEEAFIPSLASGFMLLGIENNGNFYFRSAGPGLYSGIGGIMCCCAAIIRKTDSAFSQELLSRLLEMLDSFMYAERKIPLSFDNCSLAEGVAGTISSLLHIAELLENDEFSKRAVNLAKRLLPCVQDDVGDVLNGLCGIALQLPKLSCEIALPVANSLFGALLATEPTLTGAAHGAAGVALALGALQKVYGDSRFDEKMLSLIEKENSYFDEDNTNWLDLRNPEKRGFMSGWCSGAPGIGMSRMKLKEYTANKKILSLCDTDIDRAKKFLSNAPEAKRDSLCCGSAARLMAASVLGVSLDKTYRELSKRVTDGNIRLFNPLDTAFVSAGLMQGVAGVGYALACYGDSDCGKMLM